MDSLYTLGSDISEGNDESIMPFNYFTYKIQVIELQL